MARAREEVRGHPLGRLFGVGVAALRAIHRTYPFTLDIRTDNIASMSKRWRCW